MRINFAGKEAKCRAHWDFVISIGLVINMVFNVWNVDIILSG